MIAPVLACMTVDKYLVKLTSQIPEKPLLHSLANGSPVVQTGKPCKETQSDTVEEQCWFPIQLVGTSLCQQQIV